MYSTYGVLYWWKSQTKLHHVHISSEVEKKLKVVILVHPRLDPNFVPLPLSQSIVD